MGRLTKIRKEQEHQSALSGISRELVGESVLKQREKQIAQLQSLVLAIRRTNKKPKRACHHG